MENHTKRIRKARRQGLASGHDLAARSTRAPLHRPTRGEDFPGPPRANARRDLTITGRKAKRQARQVGRRLRAAR